MKRTLLAFILLCLPVSAQMFPLPGPGRKPASVASPYLYYGYNCNGTSAMTCSNGAGSQTAISAYAVSKTITTGANVAGYTVNACGTYFQAKDGTNGHTRCAIYTVSGTTATLVTNCAQSSDQTIATAPSWTETAMPAGCTLAASTTYQVFVEFDGAATAIGMTAVGTTQGSYATHTYGVMGATITGVTASTSGYAIYVKVTAR